MATPTLSTHNTLPSVSLPATPHGTAVLHTKAGQPWQHKDSTQPQLQIEGIAQHLKIPAIAVPPVNRLPPEILGEIFLWIPTSVTRPRNYQHAIPRLSLVCKSWRDATCHTPRLWCDIWLEADSPMLPYEAISLWPSRAGMAPKHLEVSATHCGGINDFFEAEVCAEYTSTCLFGNAIFGRLLRDLPGEWQSVIVNCPTLECLKHFVAPLRQGGPHGWNSIQTLKVITTKCCAWPDGKDPTPFLDFVPETVTTLSLHLPLPHEVGFPDGDWAVPLGIPPPVLHRLSRFELFFGMFVHVDTPSLFDTLRHCTNLESLKIDFSFATLSPIEPGLPSESSILLPKLRCLDLHQVDWALPDLKKLEMPSLRELRVSLLVNEDAWRLYGHIPLSSSVGNSGMDADLVDFIRGRHDISTNLHSLHIRAVSFDNNTLFHLLRDLRALTHLKLEYLALNPYPPDDFLNLMTHTPPCLPSLKTLEILKLRHDRRFEIPSLSSFAQSRDIDLTLTHF